MSMALICMGRLKEKYWRDAAAEYEKRLTRYTKFETIELPDLPEPQNSSPAIEAQIKEKEGAAILAKIKPSDYVIAMTSLMDTEKGLKRLADALMEIDEDLCEEILQTVFHEQLGSDRKKNLEKEAQLAKMPKAVSVMKLGDAINLKGQRITLKDSLNMVSQEFVYLYPPGIPILAPGEKITKEILDRISWYQSMGLSVQGLSDPSLYSIITVAEE